MSTPDSRPPLPVGALDRYLAGEATPEEARIVTAWMAAHPGAAERLRPPAQSWDVDRAAFAMRERMRAETARSRVPARRRPPSRRSWRWGGGLALAAAAALVVAIVSRRPPTDSATSEMAAAGSHLYATGTGQTATVTLADGSRVTMAPRTTLRVDAAFGRSARLVLLDGEAVFDVAAADGAPFVVRTGGVTTRVLGTTFAVRHYDTDPSVRVAVIQGRVSSGGARGAVLAAGMMGEITDSTVMVRPDSAARYVAWTHGQLVFHRTPTPEVLAALTRWYGYQFRLADSTIALQQLTAGVDVRSPAEALATLKLLLDVDVTVDGNLVTLSPRRPATPVRRDTREPIAHSTTEVGR